MLKLDNITKVYKTSDTQVDALKGISIAFRKSEFVSILGPSGCGKTTLLNIIGGLDKYTSGDLFIEGKSTKNFTSHDWDVYRNHKIGFVFQSYNLIPHENILENVELSLTIGGISKQERERRAKEALDKVGLKGLYKKMPNQLSGGQCQRVAIARALVNQPSILLADEPTGALDSVTSLQIMDLIKEISKEKLVIMVTHNPDLAEKYSTRIVKLLDGNLVDDSNPYSLEEEKKEFEPAPIEANKSAAQADKAKMSLWTAFKLSVKNLWSKAKRTTLIIIASSIGIVGVSAVLSVSNGVKTYIGSIQDDMLSGNPVQISESSFDLAQITNSMSNDQKSKIVTDSIKNGKIDIDFMLETLVTAAKKMGSSTIQNTITKDYENFIDDMPSKYYAALQKYYGINPKFNIYTEQQIEGHEANEKYSISAITAICTSILKVIRDGEFKNYASMVDSYTNVLSQSISDEDYVMSQYDMVKGRFPKAENEMMLVLNHEDMVTEFVLTLLGYYSQTQFMNAVYHYTAETDPATGQKVYDPEYDDAKFQQDKTIDMDKILNKPYYYYPNNNVYVKNTNPLLATTRPFNYIYQPDSSWTNGMEMKVVGIISPKKSVKYGCLNSGLYYTPSFTQKYLNDNYDSEFTTFIRDYSDQHDGEAYPCAIVTNSGVTQVIGVAYSYNFSYKGEAHSDTALVGSSNSTDSLISIISSIGGGGSGIGLITSKIASKNVGGNKIPSTIRIYPKSFNDKYLVTDYLDIWNSKTDITLSNGQVITRASREDIKYTDNLQLIISLINGVIDIVTIALVAFISLSLVVSTVMIAIITYVSVMERIKEIGVIRSLGGRKRDVSNLFYAETFVIGLLSGLFGVIITYIIELVLNLTVGRMFNLGMISNLPIGWAGIIILISIALTAISGVVPASAAAKKDPVVALRTE